MGVSQLHPNNIVISAHIVLVQVFWLWKLALGLYEHSFRYYLIYRTLYSMSCALECLDKSSHCISNKMMTQAVGERFMIYTDLVAESFSFLFGTTWVKGRNEVTSAVAVILQTSHRWFVYVQCIRALKTWIPAKIIK